MVGAGSYEYLAQERVIYGRPAAEAVVEEAERLEAGRVFIVASRSLSRNTDVVDRISAALGARTVGLFDACVQHVPRPSVLEAAEAARAAEPDLVVTVGGGTPIDTVKVMLVCLAHDVRTAAELDQYRVRVRGDGGREVPQLAAPPMRQIIVPTTLSGAEFSNLGGCTDPERKIKDGYVGREIGGLSVILDPQITLHTPEWLWLSTGIRAVDHAVESICSTAPIPLVDATCLHALKLFGQSLRRNRESPEDLEARLDCQLATWLASSGINRVPYGASHGIGHALGAVAGVPHGYTSCVMLPAVLSYNEPVNGARQALISEALGDEGEAAADVVAELISDLGLPRSLPEVGVARDHYDAIAEAAMGNYWVRTNPRLIEGRADLIALLEAAEG